MLKIGDIVTTSWTRKNPDSPWGVVVGINEYNSYINYNVKWFDSEQQDGEYLGASLIRVDDAI